MHRPKVTIAQLVLLIAIVAIGLAALRSDSPTVWSGVLFSITLFAMIWSLLGIALARGARRVFWSGFAKLAIESGSSGMKSVPLGFMRATATGGGFGGAAGTPGLTDFVRVGTSMEALLWAFLGGWAARYFASGRDQVAESPHRAAASAPSRRPGTHSRDVT